MPSPRLFLSEPDWALLKHLSHRVPHETRERCLRFVSEDRLRLLERHGLAESFEGPFARATKNVDFSRPVVFDPARGDPLPNADQISYRNRLRFRDVPLGFYRLYRASTDTLRALTPCRSAPAFKPGSASHDCMTADLYWSGYFTESELCGWLIERMWRHRIEKGSVVPDVLLFETDRAGVPVGEPIAGCELAPTYGSKILRRKFEWAASTNLKLYVW